ncbi:MAG: DUF2914 domain-containing protein [Gammaproteobacteria bacterium]|nr:DUF2914 domain-containing protein [Gammaproteobacteria bacterium]
MKYHILFAAILFGFNAVVMAEDTAVPAKPSLPATVTPAAEAGSDATSVHTGNVVRATFASAIQNREPVDHINEANASQIYYFSELRGMAGQRVTHRWEYNGEIMAEVPFEVGGERWRIYSSKRLLPDWKGEWKASVIANDGQELAVNTIIMNDIQPNHDAPNSANDAVAPLTGIPNKADDAGEGGR